MVKISFIGDIMCEKPLLKAAKLENGGYDFSQVFSEVKGKFSESDYVVGNLETVCAGKEAEYTSHIYSFNTPDSFIEAIKNAGIDMVTTANNHCLDRGVRGLKRTIALLDQYGVEHTGTFASSLEKENLLVKDFNGLRVAFLAYTYGTNLQINNEVLNEDEEYCVNILQPQDADFTKKNKDGLKEFIFKLLLKIITVEQWFWLKNKIKLKVNKPTVDNNLEHLKDCYIEMLKSDLRKAKNVADYIIVCLHSGGQFNVEPGQFSKFMINFISEHGADLVVGTHPHIVQKFELMGNKMLGFYSLGNFSISPSSFYLIPENLPEYSIMLHLYLTGEREKVLNKITFTILKAVEDKKSGLVVYPVSDLAKTLKQEKEIMRLVDDVSFIYNRFMDTKQNSVSIIDEYILTERN